MAHGVYTFTCVPTLRNLVDAKLPEVIAWCKYHQDDSHRSNAINPNKDKVREHAAACMHQVKASAPLGTILSPAVKSLTIFYGQSNRGSF